MIPRLSGPHPLLSLPICFFFFPWGACLLLIYPSLTSVICYVSCKFPSGEHAALFFLPLSSPDSCIRGSCAVACCCHILLLLPFRVLACPPRLTSYQPLPKLFPSVPGWGMNIGPCNLIQFRLRLLRESFCLFLPLLSLSLQLSCVARLWSFLSILAWTTAPLIITSWSQRQRWVPCFAYSLSKGFFCPFAYKPP